MIDKNQIIGTVAAVVLIVASITGVWLLLMVRGSRHSSAEAVVRSYLTAVCETRSASRYPHLFDPQDLQDLEDRYRTRKEEIRELLQDYLDEVHRANKQGNIAYLGSRQYDSTKQTSRNDSNTEIQSACAWR